MTEESERIVYNSFGIRKAAVRKRLGAESSLGGLQGQSVCCPGGVGSGVGRKSGTLESLLGGPPAEGGREASGTSTSH